MSMFVYCVNHKDSFFIVITLKYSFHFVALRLPVG
jgi:hypothetical protein